VKALSVRQPWAWAILNGKPIENRDWRYLPSYRGPLLLHAAKGMTAMEYGDAATWIGRVFGLKVPKPAQLDRGGLVGACNLVAVIDQKEIMHPPISPAPDVRWFFGPIGLVLADVRPLPFMPYKGALGFFDVPDHLLPSEALR